MMLFSKLVNKVYLIHISPMIANIKLQNRNIQTIRVYHNTCSNSLLRILNYTNTQIKILLRIIKICKEVKLFIFYIGGEGLILPSIFLKLLKRKIVLTLPGFMEEAYPIKKDPLFKFKFIRQIVNLIVNINLNLTDKIIVQSYTIIHRRNLAKYRRKILVAEGYFLDFNKFNVKKKIDERPIYVGYVGRLSAEKGILNFVKSVHLILDKKPNVYFAICGKGNLINIIESIVNSKRLKPNIKLFNWIPHNKVPYFLNNLKLLVLPSYTEGLPKIVLEAMACGTPVLATPVGGIPDIIRDGETGFLLESNNPKHIAEKIVELLNKPELLEKVSINAYKFVKENFNYEKTLEDWRKILNKLM